VNESNATPKKVLVLRKEDIRQIRVRSDIRTGLNVQSVKMGQGNCNTCNCNTTSAPVLQV
jgi:hypothetical protein